MFSPDEDGVFARITVSPGRRLMALVVLYGFGALLIYMAFSSLAGAFGTVILIALGIAVLVGAEAMRRNANAELLLTAAGLEDQTGLLLAPIDQIQSVSRGAFAAKPSNGFTLVMKTKQPRGWKPGLWWRIGRRVGVGGVVSAGAAKFMAEQIAFRIAEKP